MKLGRSKSKSEAVGKRVCMIAYTNYSTDPRVRREAETLARHWNSVVCLALCENTVAQTYELRGVTVRELPVRKYRGKSNGAYIRSYISFLARALAACTRLTLNKQFDAVHVHNMPDFLVFAAIVPRLLGKKMILDVHDSMPETYASKFGKSSRLIFKVLCLEETLCCRLAHKVICVNDIQRNALVGRGIPRSKTAVVLNVPDHHIFKVHEVAGNGRRNGEPSPFRVVYHGTIDLAAGLDLAIEAITRLVRVIPDLEFHVLGTGKDLEECVAMAQRLGVEDRVRFSRKMFPVHDLPEHLKDMDVGVIPNRMNIATELQLPVKMLEYVALGIPVVGARLKTIQHYFTAEMISYFEPGNANSLAAAIHGLWINKEKRDDQILKAQAFFDTYGWEKHQMDLLRLYETV
jgi:glycosyltransferase involved in cell wall biosynthesis